MAVWLAERKGWVLFGESACIITSHRRREELPWGHYRDRRSAGIAPSSFALTFIGAELAGRPGGESGRQALLVARRAMEDVILLTAS
jgi:hypothetical protein